MRRVRLAAVAQCSFAYPTKTARGLVTGYHAANEELRIASAKAARIEAGENYVNETA